jgi:signal transduction histidine kinase
MTSSPAIAGLPPTDPRPAEPVAAGDLSRALEASERFRAMGEMAAAEAHYINNALGTLVSHVEILRMNPADAATVAEFAEAMMEVCRKAASVTRTLSEFARPARLEDLEPLDLNRLIADLHPVLEPVAREQQKRVRFPISLDMRPGEPVTLSGRSYEVRQVVINLVRNGVEALTSAGSVRVTTSLLPGSPGSGESEGEAVAIRVTDTGPGIPPEDAERVFEPFFTTKPPPALGLGLTVARGIVERAGGHLRHERTAEGTVFEAVLPLRPPMGPPSE